MSTSTAATPLQRWHARAADGLGIEIHQNTEVVGIDVAHDRVVGVRTAKGSIATPDVINCTAGWSTPRRPGKSDW